MAREGIRFTQFYVSAPICSPSRAGLITGQFPARWRITSFLQTRKGNRGCEQADYLDPAAPSLPRLLKQAGYATAHIGKWHLGGGRDVTNAPLFSAYGYDLGIGTYESPEPHPDLTATNWVWSPQDKVKRHERTRWMVQRTLDFFRANRSRPCFVNLWLDDTHTPYVPSAEQLAAVGVTADRPTDQERCRAVLVEMDRQLGALLDGLHEVGVGTNTLVLFLGDNGALPTYGKRNAPLRGSKLSLYEGGIRVPFIAWWPGRIPANRVDESSVLTSVDFLPTLAALAGTKAETTHPDGEDASQALYGESFTRRKALFWEYGRNGEFFSYPKEPFSRSPNVSMRQGVWKVLVNADGSSAELYDVVSDPGEKENLVGTYPDRAREMSRAALAWRKSLP
jgi:arylsulfatase A-like enzyme